MYSKTMEAAYSESILTHNRQSLTQRQMNGNCSLSNSDITKNRCEHAVYWLPDERGSCSQTLLGLVTLRHLQPPYNMPTSATVCQISATNRVPEKHKPLCISELGFSSITKFKLDVTDHPINNNSVAMVTKVLAQAI